MAAERSFSSPSISAEIRSFMPLPPAFLHLPTLVLPRPQQRPQLLRDRLARPEDTRPDGADRAVHDLRDVLVAHPFDLAQLDRGTQLFRQLLDRGVHRLRNFIR